MKTLTENEAFALVSPCPFTLLTSLNQQKKPYVMGISWVTRTSLNPCLMLVAIAHDRYSHEGIKLHREFVINYPNTEQEEAAWTSRMLSGRCNDKVNKTGFELIDSLKVQAPTIKDATVALECKVVNLFTTGDHTAFVGKVVAMRGNKDKTQYLEIKSMTGFFPGMKQLIQISPKVS